MSRSRSLNTVPQKIISASLAVASCVGLVAVIAARSQSDTKAQETERAQLNAEWASLKSYKAELDTYSKKLNAIAKKIQTQTTKPVVAPKPTTTVKTPQATTKAS